ncbi:MAG: Z1 domain-containing protein, partial [Longimicrobiales bacterium]
RWFGYREGYLDLCRLYTTGEMESWFSHIAMASDELKEDFRRMVASGSTPREFGHRVRSHPVMLVTSSVKMRHGQEITVTFAGGLSETINFRQDRATLARNLQAADALLSAAAEDGSEVTPWRSVAGRLWAGLRTDAVVAFLRQYEEHAASKKVKTKLLADYVEAEQRAGRLGKWTVVLASGSGRTATIGPVETQLVERAWYETETLPREALRAENHYRIRRLLNPTDEALDLSVTEYDEALERSVDAWIEDPSSMSRPGEDRARPERPDGAWIRAVRPETRGLLLLYPLDPGHGEDLKVSPDAAGHPIIGFALSFPTVSEGRASKVRYTVGNVYFRQEVLGEGSS